MSSGRPRATSRATIAEAASELFLERGYAETTVADITTRAGVSRSTFFNYFSSKADVLWSGFDERADTACATLAAGADPVSALRALVDGFAPDSLALAITHAAAMGMEADLATERALRTARLARAVSDRLVDRGEGRLAADVRGGALAGALLAAVWAWAVAGPGRSALAPLWEDALALAKG
ncbi:TetR family transcriptional regulator [Microbacterium hominis]|uniref:TetR/AcrR family transcriptional regulator n=1 Tax=Microbacterium hominis TaxID=162426 RepID=UPI0019622BD5|nr:TetR/AcrR family transcriptional regulator [Microbacterium hominis]QRY40957.1 TetR family transcriptional regulator [Microbacterium hominis]